MGKGPKKRKKGVGDPVSDDFSSDTDSFKSGIGMDDEEDDKYSVYKASNYIRKYPDGSRNTEYIVFLANKENKPFCDKDRILISKALRKHCVSGVKHLKTINKYRVGIIFDISNNANMFVQNKKILDELLLTASIPASAAECTGVLKNVPLSLSNKKIFSVIASTRNVIQVRRIMRRSKEHGLQPTSVVAVVMAIGVCTVLVVMCDLAIGVHIVSVVMAELEIGWCTVLVAMAGSAIGVHIVLVVMADLVIGERTVLVVMGDLAIGVLDVLT
ncbi:hypothetical protein ACJJTC_016496 [Scirpophaga incertulas]